MTKGFPNCILLPPSEDNGRDKLNAKEWKSCNVSSNLPGWGGEGAMAMARLLCHSNKCNINRSTGKTSQWWTDPYWMECYEPPPVHKVIIPQFTEKREKHERQNGIENVPMYTLSISLVKFFFLSLLGSFSSILHSIS